MLWMGMVQLCFALLSLWVFHDALAGFFLEAAIPTLLLAALPALLVWRCPPTSISYRDALLFATLTWLVLGILGGLPIMLIANVSFTDATFESISGLTTTGASILSGLDSMPASFLLYRQFLHWMGGLGIVIFVVAILPMLNVGGMRLLRAETPGPFKDDKLTPRIKHTAHYLWLVYVLLTLACALAYYAGGMTLYDAVAHSFATISTGGFSTHDSGIWFYESQRLLLISDIFMLLGALNFALHFSSWHGRSLRVYWRDEESHTFLLLTMALAAVLAVWLWTKGTYNFLDALGFALFETITFMTSTGFTAADLSSWPAGSDLFLVTVAYLGGCAGSTAGGNKIIRSIVAVKMIWQQLRLLIYPRAAIPIHYNGIPISNSVRSAVMAFLFFTAASTLLFTGLLMMTGLNAWSAFTAVAACLNVLGPGFGEVASNFQPVSDVGTWLLSAAMLVGRLEYLTIFALLLPAFWKY